MSNERAAADSDPNSGVDPYQRLQIARNPDGSITRLFKCPDAPPSSDPKLPTPVLTKDIPINQSNNTWLRLFLPRHVLDQISPTTKLPLVVYYHGGGLEASYYLGQPQPFSMISVSTFQPASP
ncbi:putative carboxylesterase [Rosa chinensis]|uniref:Putative carboxylesterase n=1 Tax=Rosa chinensis TaxID=74649 RepID=A0A2P6SMV9_ROSCH|nr:putative carboxylesterase [Rosa chinensis]